ncbi:uncharacterized protein LOC125946755 [Dermacentor silvarum]|uniref:uncharacterized protein LOC125946755 n=1 Tax=Dermacentor silvarum TaxID=543639 RepID=UPI002101AA10|nr:uncharacterized protein LOC125946755 [Dermacentor silvarum]
MEPEVQARVGLPVVLVNRDGLYVIIAVLGVSILGCACVLTYSLGNYGKLMKYAEEVRNYIFHRDTKAAVKEHSGGKQTTAAGDTRPSDVRSVTVQIPTPNASANGPRVDAGPSLGAGPTNSDNASLVRSVNDTFVVSAKQEEYGAAAADLPLWNASTAGYGSGYDSPSSGVAATAR